MRENLKTLYAAAQDGFAGKTENIARFLKHLGEPTEPPPLAPARAPPYWQARELRHRPQAQTELFDA